MKRPLLLVTVILSLVAAAGCSSDEVTSSSTGRVNLLLTDAPLDLSTVSAVNVTLTEVLLYARDPENPDDGGVKMRLTAGEGTALNLLDFQNGNTVTVAALDVPVGDYKKVRLGIASADLHRDDDDDPATPDLVEPIFIPSAKVDVPVGFTVSGGETVDVTLDFDAELSVQVNTTNGTHPYILRPVIVPVGVSRN